MFGIKLITVSLYIFLNVSLLFAEPTITSNCCTPKPVGGMEVLAENTNYPMWAKNEKISSGVVLNFRVDQSGAVSDLHVSESGGPVFDKSAIEAVLNTEWSPAMQNGMPVAVTYELPFEFKYNK